MSCLEYPLRASSEIQCKAKKIPIENIAFHN